MASANRKFQVVRMTAEDFLSTGKMNDCLKDAVTGISKFQWLRFKKEDPFTVFYKCSLNEDLEFESYDMRQPKVGRPHSTFTLNPLYESPVKITTAKFKDLQSLLQFLRPIHHGFYKNLKHGKKVNKNSVKPSTSTVPDDQNNDEPTDLDDL